jgi:NAD(P)-dependent dehydrogenase (short-subunit alcohol dehydrogenase family)
LARHAVEEFGGVDILVNNAGIFWMDEFPKVSTSDVQRQLAVHVIGSMHASRACWPHMAEAGYGRIVMTSSTGALGAANMTAYGLAKAGVLGLARALAMAGEPAGIRVNVVCPMAMTRMMSAGMGEPEPPDDPDRSPSLVSPLVALLSHESCPSNGETYLSGMRRYARFFIGETEGYVHPEAEVTPEDIVSHWDEITNLTDHHLVPDCMTWSALNETRITKIHPTNLAN